MLEHTLAKVIANAIYNQSQGVYNSYDDMLADIGEQISSISVLNVKVKKLHPDAVLPEYKTKLNDGTPTAVGMDITAVGYQYDAARDCYTYHSGLAFELPIGYGMFIQPRSMNYKTSYYMPNSPGILDPTYGEELLIKFKNRDNLRGQQPIPPYEVGDRVAQIYIIPYPFINFIEVDEVVNLRSGFGSTGLK